MAASMHAGMITLDAACLFGAWAKFGRHSLPLTALLAAPFYMAWKVPMYMAFLFKRQKEWNRTARAQAAPVLPQPAVAAVAMADVILALVGTGPGRSFELAPVGLTNDEDYNVDR